MRPGTCALIVALALGAGPVRPDEPSSIRRTTLPNGITLITQRDTSAAVTVLEILSKGGKKSEPARKDGLAYLTTRLALEIPDQTKAQELTERASQWGTTLKGDYTVIHLESLTEHFEATLDVFLEILKDPLFTGIRIDRVRDYMNAQRKVEADDNVTAAHLAHMGLWFGPAGYAGSMFGEEAALKKLRSRDVEAYFNAYFAPDNLILVAISDLEEPKLGALLAGAFGPLRAAANAVRTPPAAPAPEAAPGPPLVLARESKQVCVSMGFGLPPLAAKTYALDRIFEYLLGKGPGSRLWPLRADERLAYTVSAQATLHRDGGLLEAYLETDPAKRDVALASLRKALETLWREGVGPDELAETKAILTSEFLRTNETRDRRTGMLGYFEAVGLGADYFEAFPTAVEAVTVEEINAYIKSAGDPAKATVVLAGSPIK